MSLLDERLKKYGLPPWPYQPAFDRIVVYTMPEEKASRETFVEGGLIVKAEVTKDREEQESPRCILVAAGLAARDQLRGDGIDVGHIVWVARFSPWRHTVERTTDGDVDFMFLRAGDVVGSEDVLRLMRDGKIKTKVGDDGKHQYVVEDSAIPRFDPPSYWE